MGMSVRAGGQGVFYGATFHARRGFAGLAKQNHFAYLFVFVDVTSLHTLSYIFQRIFSKR